MQLPNAEVAYCTMDDEVYEGVERYYPVSDCLPFIRAAESKNRLWPQLIGRDYSLSIIIGKSK